MGYARNPKDLESETGRAWDQPGLHSDIITLKLWRGSHKTGISL